MWWIQGVTPATLTAIGLVRTTVHGTFQRGAKESYFQSLTHTWSLGTNSWIFSPRGNGTLSCTNLVPWFITLPSCSICCEISSPLTWGKFVDTCFIIYYYYVLLFFIILIIIKIIIILFIIYASHTQFHTKNSHGTMASSWVWAEPLEVSPPRSSQSLWYLENVSLSVWLVHSTIPELWGLYAICNFHWIFRALHTCWIKSATKAGPLSDPILVGNPNLGIISRSRHWATSFAFSVRVGKPQHSLRRYIPWVLAWFKVHLECLLTVFLEGFVYVQGQHWPFSFVVAFSASASWSWAGLYRGRVKVNSGIFESTKVLIDPPPAAPNFWAACFAALSASQFPRVCGVFLLVTPTMYYCYLFRFPYSM